MNIIALYILVAVLPTVLIIIVAIVSSRNAKKRLAEIEEELGLTSGNTYDIITNNGNKHLNLTYSHIAYGKQSQNGRINIYFTRPTSYRGSYVQKEIMIKYDNIWKIAKN